MDWPQHGQVTELYAQLTAYDDDIGRLNSQAPCREDDAVTGREAGVIHYER